MSSDPAQRPLAEPLSQGPVCRVCGTTLDYPFPLGGRDKQVPPIHAVGGTCLSGPLYNVGSFILLQRA